MSDTRLSQLDTLTNELGPQLVADRRDIHQHAEMGWCEFYTAAKIARRLTDLGYEVHLGREVLKDEDRLGLPDQHRLDARWDRARQEGADPEFLPALKGGYTGVVGLLRNGDGPTIGLRFDIDAIGLTESTAPEHRPAREGFASLHPEATHACGHDGHAAVGMGLAAALLKLRDCWQGTVKLIFQPAEEGVRGAKAMVEAGVVDDVDIVLAHHLYSGWAVGEIAGGKGGSLATTKFDAEIKGRPAHAAGAPEQGKNAMLAAATAVLNLYALPRHSKGKTRINVGQLEAGTGRNVIPAHAHLVIETRGESSEINDHMFAAALRILNAAAEMHGCTMKTRLMGGASSAASDPELAAQVEAIAMTLGFTLRDHKGGGGSEDFTYMMKRVQERGGQTTYIAVGADLGDFGHHTANFDIDETALGHAVKLLAGVVIEITNKN